MSSDCVFGPRYPYVEAVGQLCRVCALVVLVGICTCYSTLGKPYLEIRVSVFLYLLLCLM